MAQSTEMETLDPLCFKPSPLMVVHGHSPFL
jgi:hypothetical protein